MNELKEKLEKDLFKQLLPARVFLDRFRLSDMSVSRVGPFYDTLYIPFFYHLSKYIFPKNMMEIGFGLGITSGCFLQKNTSVEHFLAFCDRELYPRLGERNIRDVYHKEFHIHHGNFLDEEFRKKIKIIKWDFVIFDKLLNYDDLRTYLDIIWMNMELNGILLIDRLVDDTIFNGFNDFCKIQNREPIIIKTKFKTGMVRK